MSQVRALGCVGPLCSGQGWREHRPGGLSVPWDAALSHLHPAASSAVTLTLPNPQWSPRCLADEARTLRPHGEASPCPVLVPAPSHSHLLKHPATRPNSAPAFRLSVHNCSSCSTHWHVSPSPRLHPRKAYPSFRVTPRPRCSGHFHAHFLGVPGRPPVPKISSLRSGQGCVHFESAYTVANKLQEITSLN